jgi:hypothetical protein
MGSTGWVLSLQKNSQHGAADKDDGTILTLRASLIFRVSQNIGRFPRPILWRRVPQLGIAYCKGRPMRRNRC